MPDIVGRLKTPRLPSAPSSPTVGELYYDTSTNILYWWNGTAWISASGGAGSDNLRYNGNWVAGSYLEGDVVVDGGISYLAVKPTSARPTAWPGASLAASGIASTATGDVAATNVQAAIAELAAEKQAISEKGNANGYASLDSGAKVPLAQLPAISGGGVDYYGNWAAGIAFKKGDVVRYNGNDYMAVNDSTGVTPPVAGFPGQGASYGTTLPATPFDGQEHILVDSLTVPTYAWRFRYTASITDGYNWVFVGGAAVVKADNGTLTTTSTSYVIGTNGSGTVAGTAFTAPRAGIYQASVHDDANANTGTTMYLGLRFGSADVQVAVPYGNAAAYLSRSGHGQGIVAAAGSSIQPIIAVGAGTLTIMSRQISILPVRVS